MAAEEPQVKPSHYNFRTYLTKPRWISVWHQLDEVFNCRPSHVMEVGKGAGVMGPILRSFDVRYTSVDIDLLLRPSSAASIIRLPFRSGAFDVVCCFQVLEHLPYEIVPAALAELRRVARAHVLISLPDARRLWRYVAHVPKVGVVELNIPRPQLRTPRHEFDGEHYWEINKSGFPLEDVIGLMRDAGLVVRRTYRVPENSYHRFFMLETTAKIGVEGDSRAAGAE